MRICLFGQRFSTNFLWLVSGFFFYFTIRSCTCCDGVVVNTENQSEKESGRHFVFQVRLASSSRRHLEIHSELLIGPSSSNGNRFLLFFSFAFFSRVATLGSSSWREKKSLRPFSCRFPPRSEAVGSAVASTG